MSDTFSLTLHQVDAINLSLDKVLAVARMVADCGESRHAVADAPAPASLFVVMQVIVEELEKIDETMKGIGRK